MAIKTKNGSVVGDKELERVADMFEQGTWPEGETRIVRGRPRLSADELRTVTFKEPLGKIAAIDDRAAQLGMSRSNYLRYLVDKDLAIA